MYTPPPSLAEVAPLSQSVAQEAASTHSAKSQLTNIGHTLQTTYYLVQKCVVFLPF